MKKKENFSPSGKLGGTERKILGELDFNLKEVSATSNPNESKTLQDSQMEIDDFAENKLHESEEVLSEFSSAQEILRNMCSQERDSLMKALASIIKETR
jgi:hypothetical protein